jgi:hypothetical protein
MRIVLSLTALLLSTAVAAEVDTKSQVAASSLSHAKVLLEDQERPDCRNRVTHARGEQESPERQGEAGSPHKPLFLYALHKQVDGCSVLVMHGNVNNMRPLPNPTDPRMMRAQ